MITTADVIDVLSAVAPTYTDEYDLQTALFTALDTALAGTGRRVEREVRLSDGVSRVDVWIDGNYWLAPGIVIEVKVDGSLATVQRQLERYAACTEVAELILVTTKSRQHHIPRELAGKPVHLVSLVEAGL